MIRSFFLVVAFAFLALIPSRESLAGRVTHLVFANGAYHLHASWKNGPNTPGESLLHLEWKSGSGHGAVPPPGPFKVVPFMPSMGHGSAPTEVEQALDEHGAPLVGVYEVKGIYFTMPGDWEVRITVKYPGDNSAEETQALKARL